jgi:hypothetical protein
LKIKYISIFLLALALLVGCDNENKEEISTNDVQKIKFELIKKQTLEGVNSYSIKLINDSDFVIKQNNVFVYYPIKINTDSSKGNEYKVEAKGNKLDIQPREKIILNVLMPFEGMGDQSLLRIDNPSIQINGYLGKIDNKHKFSIGGDLIKK